MKCLWVKQGERNMAVEFKNNGTEENKQEQTKESILANLPDDVRDALSCMERVAITRTAENAYVMPRLQYIRMT